ncbi:MAG: hypothetical protein ACTSVB_08390 [Candidatus Heimdallarchaeaceae archaeon]
MESYDEIVGFDYTDENEWKNWIREKFLPLHKQLSIILKLRESLENILKTNLKEAFSQRYTQEILLGGITKEGEYPQNSLAKLYKDALGIYINPKEWVAYCRTGLNPVENGIECKFEDTSFLAFITEIKELVEKVLSKIGVELQNVEDKEIKEIVNSPEKILEIIKEIYKSIISISANYDYHMFFVLNTRCIPRFFIEKAYPKLEENLEKVAEVLELEEKFVPDIDDEKIKRNYTLIGYKENGLAYLLFRLNKETWKTMAEIKIFELIGITLSDPRKNYLEKVKNSFEKLGWKKPEYIHISDPPGSQHVSGYSGPWYYTYYVEGIIITRYHERGWSARGNYYNDTHECNIPLLQLMNDTSPALFLGIYYLRVKGNSIQIIESD